MTVRLPPTLDNPNSEGWTIDFRETAPAAANATMFRDNPILSQIGGLSVGIPGELKGLADAHQRWGKLPWKLLVEPAAKLAAGWEVGVELGRRIKASFIYVCHFWQKLIILILVTSSMKSLCSLIRTGVQYSPLRGNY